MKVLNINFTSINANRKSVPQGNINVSNNVKIEDVEESNMALGSGRKALRLTFSYESEFNPDIATIKLEGEMTVLAKEEKADQLLDEFEENNRFNKEDMTTFLNNIMNKASLEAILISRELDLPSPVRLPRVKQD